MPLKQFSHLLSYIFQFLSFFKLTGRVPEKIRDIPQVVHMQAANIAKEQN